MLLTLLYHRAAQGKYANPPNVMKAHLEHLAKNYQVILPGEVLQRMAIQVCLTFDDAFFDFFHIIYPLLRELDLRVILAVPTKYILERTDIPSNIRLATQTSDAEKVYKEKAPYCTWEELEEMVHSGYVQVASHSHSHCDLTSANVDLEKEVIHSKNLIEKRLSTKVNTFIYPFGKFNKKVQRFVEQHYPYAMRIGSAANHNWAPLMYRVCADNLESLEVLFHKKFRLGYHMNWALNRLRGR